jgi:hypothetical protein
MVGSAQPADIAKDTQENLGSLDVVSVGSISADEMGGELYGQFNGHRCGNFARLPPLPQSGSH